MHDTYDEVVLLRQHINELYKMTGRLNLYTHIIDGKKIDYVRLESELKNAIKTLKMIHDLLK